MQTHICVSFRVPQKAFEILKIIRSQNSQVDLELDTESRTISILSSLLDFQPYADDWEKEDFENNDFWDGVE